LPAAENAGGLYLWYTSILSAPYESASPVLGVFLALFKVWKLQDPSFIAMQNTGFSVSPYEVAATHLLPPTS